MILGLDEKELFAAGHRACAGCGAALAVRYALKAAGPETIVVSATGCVEVISTPYPQTAWKVPWLHVAFENAAAVASGVDSALKWQGKRDQFNILVMAGDGGTFDIGFQALSGAAERRQKFCYICFDNGAYMNTGAQRSGATPQYASTSTSPAGKKVHGKMEFKKPMPFIMAAHGAYVATANMSYPQDFVQKIQKALKYNGPSYIQIFVACPTGWKYPTDMTIEIGKLAFQTGITPLYEIENGILKITKEISDKKPVTEFTKYQGRFKHLTKEELDDMQLHVDKELEKIKKYADTKVEF